MYTAIANLDLFKNGYSLFLDGLEKDEYSGIIQVLASDQRYYLVLDHGKVVLDEFTENYAQIICGTSEYNHLLNLLNNTIVWFFVKTISKQVS